MKDFILKTTFVASLLLAWLYAMLARVNNLSMEYVIPFLFFSAYTVFFTILNRGKWIFKEVD